MMKFRLLAILMDLILLACLFGAIGQPQMQTYATYSADYPYAYSNPYYSQNFYSPYYYPYPDYLYPYNPFYRYYYPYYPHYGYYYYPFDSFPLGTFGLIAGGNYPIKVVNSQPSIHK